MFGTTKVDKRLQLYHHDNGDLEFIKRPIMGESSVEIDNTGEPIRAWLDKFQTLYPFDGYGKVPADAVQLTYGRHFFLELHNILPDIERPPEDNAMDNPFITAIAEARAIEVTKSAKPRTIYEKLTWILGAALFIELLIWGISYASVK